MRIVLALGRRALLRRGEAPTTENQLGNLRRMAPALVELCAAGHQIVMTHGCGPQASLLALQAAATPDRPYPLASPAVAGAGMIGCLIERHLANLLPGSARLGTIPTQVLVDRQDPGFQKPTRQIGPVYSESEARMLAAERGWRVAGDSRGWRRVVASPRPRRILEAGVIEMLLESGVIVICAGGLPVTELEDGSLIGVEALVDKDQASALLAEQLRADWLMLLTDVDALYDDWGTGQARPIRSASPADLADRSFAPGTMAPKVRAACAFVRATGRRAGIGALGDAGAILAGAAGTLIEAEPQMIRLQDWRDPAMERARRAH